MPLTPTLTPGGSTYPEDLKIWEYATKGGGTATKLWRLITKGNGVPVAYEFPVFGPVKDARKVFEKKKNPPPRRRAGDLNANTSFFLGLIIDACTS